MSERKQTYRAIKTDITSGKIKLGERLLEAKLAARYGVTRTPIREVIRQLKKPVGGFGQFGAKIALADVYVARLETINNEH